ncbi:MAG: hypothetical protein K2X81_27500 [Candidatus Obscuribacterales bacterium]|nr:hypothetical protein [Candidatus Obscuribacterales bacterium]
MVLGQNNHLELEQSRSEKTEETLAKKAEGSLQAAVAPSEREKANELGTQAKSIEEQNRKDGKPGRITIQFFDGQRCGIYDGDKQLIPENKEAALRNREQETSKQANLPFNPEQLQGKASPNNEKSNPDELVGLAKDYTNPSHEIAKSSGQLEPAKPPVLTPEQETEAAQRKQEAISIANGWGGQYRIGDRKYDAMDVAQWKNDDWSKAFADRDSDTQAKSELLAQAKGLSPEALKQVKETQFERRPGERNQQVLDADKTTEANIQKFAKQNTNQQDEVKPFALVANAQGEQLGQVVADGRSDGASESLAFVGRLESPFETHPKQVSKPARIAHDIGKNAAEAASAHPKPASNEHPKQQHEPNSQIKQKEMSLHPINAHNSIHPHSDVVHPPKPGPTEHIPYPPKPDPPEHIPYPPKPDPPEHIPYPPKPDPPEHIPYPPKPDPPEHIPYPKPEPTGHITTGPIEGGKEDDDKSKPDGGEVIIMGAGGGPPPPDPDGIHHEINHNYDPEYGTTDEFARQHLINPGDTNPQAPTGDKEAKDKSESKEEQRPTDAPLELPPEIEERAKSEPEKLISERIEELKEQIPKKAQDFGTTMAAAVAEDSEGKRYVLISTSEKGDHLRRGVTLNEGETLVEGAGDGHAEIKIKNYIEDKKLKLVTIGATRPICEDNCEPQLKPMGTTFATPLKSETGKQKK